MSACGNLVDDILRRVRDPQGTANPRALVRDYIDRAQVLFVRSTGTLITDNNVTFTAERLVYDINPAETLRILDIFVASRRLWPIRWAQMDAQRGPLWWRQTSSGNPRVWSPLGTTHYMIYPAVLVDTAGVLRWQQRPAALTSDDVEMEMPDEFFPEMLDFVESAIYVRQRDPALEAAMGRAEGEGEPEHEEVA